MDWKAIGKQLANIGLPLLGTAVAGPGGALAAKGLLTALGLSESATPEQAATALGTMTGDQLVAIRQCEADLAKAQLTAATETEKAATGAVTDRWKADMSSDSWLSKQVRPIVLVYWTIAVSIMAFASYKYKFDPLMINLVEYSYMAVVTAYFVGRSAQHVTNMITGYGKQP